MDVRLPDGTVVKNVPDAMSKADLTAKLSANGYDVAKLNVAPQEQNIAPVPVQAPKAASPNSFARGAFDPIDAGAQLLTHILPDAVVKAGNRANNWLADKGLPIARLPDGGVDQLIKQQESKYQDQRKAAGESGADWGRLAGNVLSPANLALASKIPAATSLIGRVGTGALSGSALGAISAPVSGDGDFATEKAKQMLVGGVTGGAMPLVTGALGRLVSPNASTNPQLAMLKSEGVNPTVGQALGGRMNALEEKLQSVPIMGDMISNARSSANKQFNKAAINRAVAPIGEKVNETGQVGVKQAGDLISNAYDDAISNIKAVKFDQKFGQDVAQLRSMSKNLVPDMQKKFDKILSDNFGTRLSGNGSMLGDTFKKVDSELGTIASRYGKSTNASEQELGDAVAQLKNLLGEQARRVNPKYSEELNKADAAWANLVRVEGAARSGMNNSGTFTPGQLNQAVRMADDSVRKRSTSRGTALMQDLADAGQNVLGNKVPNSFTADRMMYGGGALASGMLNPLIPLGLLGGAGAYTQPMQKLLTSVVSSRPSSAVKASELVRKSAPFLTPGAIGLLNLSQQ